MKKLKTPFSITSKTKHLIDILANKLELSKSNIVSLAIKQLFESLINKSDSPIIDYTWTANDDYLDMEKLVSEVSKQFFINLTPIADAMAIVTTELIELEKRLNKLEGKPKETTPKLIFELKRASEGEIESKDTAKEIDI